jgi:hypothetical protein
MKKTIRSLIKIFLFVSILLVSPIFPKIVNARSYFSGTVTLPYEVHWGEAVLSPGDYLIRIGSLNRVAQIYSRTGTQMYFTSTRFINLNEKRETCLILTADGDKHLVNSLTMPFFGISQIYKPLTKIQRENVARGEQMQSGSRSLH